MGFVARVARFCVFAVLSFAAMLAKEQGIVVIGIAGTIDTIHSLASTNPLHVLRTLLLSRATNTTSNNDDDNNNNNNSSSSSSNSKQSVRDKRKRAAPVSVGVVRAQLAACVALGAALLWFRLSIMHGQQPPFNEHEIPAAFARAFLTRALTMNYYVAFNAASLAAPLRLCHDWSHSSIPLVERIGDARNAQTAAVYAALAGIAVWAMGGRARRVRRVSGQQQQQQQQQHGMKGMKLGVEVKKGKRNGGRSDDAVGSNNARMWTLFALVYLVLSFLPASNLLFTVGFVVAERVLYTPRYPGRGGGQEERTGRAEEERKGRAEEGGKKEKRERERMVEGRGA